jgi:quercetin dioxygenase-like cupin family protein
MASQWHVRSERPAATPFLRFDIAERVRQLEEEPVWDSGTRNAITLTKEPTLRVVLTALKQGTKLHAHKTEGPLSIQVISGQLALRAAGQSAMLGPGEVAVLESAVDHEVEAIQESAFLLTIAPAA